MSGNSTRRQGGKRIRAMRQAPSFAPGPLGTKGGMYRPLSEADIQRIHSAALDVLEQTGFKGATDTVRDLALGAGCKLDGDGRLLFPRALVEDIIDGAARDFVLHGQTPSNDIEVRDGHVHFATGGAAVKMLDSASRAYRPSTLEDLFDIARLVDKLDNIQWFARPVVATNLEDWRELDLNTVYACARGSTKHIGTSITLDRHVPEIIKMLDLMTGRDGGFAQRPFVSVHATTVVSPLTFAEDSSNVATAAARAGMPILSQTGPLAGATAPAALAGTLVQTVAESLGALVAINLVKKGHPVITSGWPFVADLRTGSFSGGSGEQALLGAGQAQMMQFYRLPTGVPAGMTDSKLPDNQAGFEKALTVTLAAMSGPSFVYESVGMLASLLGCSLEAMVIDNEMIHSIRRSMKGIEVTDASLSIDVIDEASRHVGHYLGNAQTLALMETEYVYPSLADRNSPDNWTEQGAQDITERARKRVAEVLSAPCPTHITPENDAAVRAAFPIRLDPKTAQGLDGRWVKGGN
ncbi:trimethylamine methyltransferase family protein [Roseovarius sp. ZX-A-9]|uniref:trimethylamine methyltransferase family protein n=1 Tax=Roseovarius sp. ZX-A-9 TaxID=3014783 RepID=UPI00232C0DCE|nr:trimethylamine methyltransferase family protein [Roseovarius sp. ZX-A-9]